MLKEIIEKIDSEKEIDVKRLSKEFGVSAILLEYILKGLEKKKYIKSLKCSECKYSEMCHENIKFCKGYGKYWMLTDKKYSS